MSAQRLWAPRHERESARVFGWIAANGERYVVAAIFAFGANALAEPPHGRVIEEKRFDGYLEEVHEGVEAADMRQLMRYSPSGLPSESIVWITKVCE